MAKIKENELVVGNIGNFFGGVMMRYLFVFVFTCVLAHFCAETHASIVGDTISGYATYQTNPIGNRFDNDTAVVSNADIEFQIASIYLPITADFADDTLTINFTNIWSSTNQHVSWEFTFSSLDYGAPITGLTVLQDTFDTSPTYSWTQDSIDIYVPGGIANEMIPSETHLLELQVITEPATGTLSGWVWIDGSSDFGYSSDEGDLVYFLSFGPVWSYNSTTGWGPDGPAGWVYVNWPFLYEFATTNLWFVLPPESGLWVFHFSTSQWELLPRIIPW